jgi:DNA-nicking Smr family endonuclease
MHDVAPLPGRTLPVDRGRPRRIEAGETSALQNKPALMSGAPDSLPPLDRFAGIDRANAERLKCGRRAIEARLDLHGMTQAEAHAALSRFIAGSRTAARRCVLVITGHGRSSGGILKQSVPRWLHEPSMRRHVLAIAPAQRQHGGAGALYVLLRRMRVAD